MAKTIRDLEGIDIEQSITYWKNGRMSDEELFDEFAKIDYDTLTEDEQQLLEQLTIEYDAEFGYCEEDD